MKSKIFSLALIAVTSNAFAWGDLGHQIVGEIAEQRMSSEAKDFVRGIIGIEPMAIAANWPDHVRDDGRFNAEENAGNDFAPFHFTEIPTGFTYDTRPNKDKKDAFGAIMGAAQLLTQPNVPREKKMIALRYLIHIVGDIHQPLHVGNNFDRGANSCYVKWNPKGEATPLHSLWDTQMVLKLGNIYSPGKDAPKYYPAFVKAMKAAAAEKFNAKKLIFANDDDSTFTKNLSTELKAWMNESMQAREKIYPDNLGGNPEAYKLRKYCMWYSDQDKNILGESSAQSKKDVVAQVLPPDYVSQFAKSIVETQLANAGTRLAAILDAIAIRAKANDKNLNLVTDEIQNKWLSEVREGMSN